LRETSPGEFQLGVFPVLGGNPVGEFLPAFGMDEAGEIYLGTKSTLAPSAPDPDTGLPTGGVYRVASATLRVITLRLDPSQEVPAPVLGGATPRGTATLEVDTATGNVSITGTFDGMSSAATLSHLHGLADPGATAPPVIDLALSGGTAGTFSGSGMLDAANLEGLLLGRTYINVHTANNGPGEIRGQVPSPAADSLAIRLEGSDAVVTWDDPSGTFDLHESGDGAIWAPSTREAEEFVGRNTVTVESPAGTGLFRLE
jgi:hypothetical protein